MIVNAWNRNVIPGWLLRPQGVSGAIKRQAGYQPFREPARKGTIPLGGAGETSAGNGTEKSHFAHWHNRM
jgi:O-acetyl-ADP-ribose deacetylase